MEDSPRCITSLQTMHPVLALATAGSLLFCAQAENIQVWSLETLRSRKTLKRHQRPVLCLLTVGEKEDRLLSAASDSIIIIWDVRSLEVLHVVRPPEPSIGDIQSLIYSHESNTVFVGRQDAAIMWFTLPDATAIAPSGVSTPSYQTKFHRFFDSQSLADRARQQAANLLASVDMTGSPMSHSSSSGSSMFASPPNRQRQLEPVSDDAEESSVYISESCVFLYAHYGCIYALDSTSLKGKPLLVSAGGDGAVKLWHATRFANGSSILELEALNTLLAQEDNAALSLAHIDETLYAGFQNGRIRVWDLESFQMIRSIKAHPTDVLCLRPSSYSLFSTACDGSVKGWANLEMRTSWTAASGPIHAAHTKGLTTDGRTSELFFTASGGHGLSIWDVSSGRDQIDGNLSCIPLHNLQGQALGLLSQFVSFASISSEETHREDCRHTAKFLQRTLESLGAAVQLLPNQQGYNPIVLATFKATTAAHRRMLYYGHYDVVPPGKVEAWTSPPFTLTGRDDYLYGRGVSDDKGPVLAIALAASKLLRARDLEIDVVLLVEGEAECNSTGFRHVVQQASKDIGPIDLVLISNSIWLTEDIPCINFGLRGKIAMRINIDSTDTDLHSSKSGVQHREPMGDLLQLIASLSNKQGKIITPEFYRDVAPVDGLQDAIYREAVQSMPRTSDFDMDALLSQWHQPSFSIHNVGTSSVGQTVIPSSVSASISVRTVPNQCTSDIVRLLEHTIKTNFKSLESPHSLQVKTISQSDWWLGDQKSQASVALHDSLQEIWARKPLWIREGGSLPLIPWLQKTFKAPTVHLPLAQASASDHLSNERIRLVNFDKGVLTLAAFFKKLSLDPSTTQLH